MEAEVDVATPAAADAGPGPGDAVSRDTPGPTPEGGHAGRRLWDDLGREVGKAVVGVEEPLRLVLVALLADGHVLVEDVPGTGKTLLARAVARALDLRTARIQGTPDLLPERRHRLEHLRGRPAPLRRRARSSRTSSSSTRSTGRRRGPSRRCSRRCRSTRSRSRARPTRCPTRSSSSRPRTRSSSRARSRCRRPSSTGSCSGSGSATRTRTAERRIARRYQAAAEPLDAIEPVIDREPRLLALRDQVRTVRVADEVEAYVGRARPGDPRRTPTSQLGASPRATVALYRAAQAAALLDGRAFVLPDDVKGIAPAVLAHRLVVDLDRTLRGATAESAMAAILASVPAPPLAPPGGSLAGTAAASTAADAPAAGDPDLHPDLG